MKRTAADLRLRVVDIGHGMAAALVARMMRDLGAAVVRVEGDVSDPFYQAYPAYAAWHDGSERAPATELSRLIVDADVLIVGGEDHPDGCWPEFDPAVAAANDRLVTLRLGGLIDRADTPALPVVDLLVQARTGFVHEQFTARPIHFSFGGTSFGSAITGLIGLWSALLDRQQTGKGQVVTATMEQGQALFWPQIWMTAQETTADFENFSPRDVRHLIFLTADDKYVHFTMGVPGAVAKLYGVLGIDVAVDPNDRGSMSMARGVRNFFGDRDLIEPAVRKWKRDDLLAAMWEVGMTVEAVKAPGECIDEEQVIANRFVRTDRDGNRVIGMPLRVELVCKDGAGPAPVDRADPGPLLAGIRVIDLGNFVAGPYASRLLADLGADVIKVEPLTGLHHVTGLRNVWASNRGKRSICIDAKHPRGARIIRQLAETADASQHNFRVGVAPRLGVDPASLRSVNPDIVTLETTAYGSKGPKAHLPGFDMGMQALSGHEMRAGGTGNIPLWYRSPFLDYGTGGLGAVALLAGLYRRNETGCAVELENSLFSSGLYFLSEMVVGADGTVTGVPPLNNDMTGFSPWERLYEAADGWIAVAARSDGMAARFAEALGVTGLGPRQSWSDDAATQLAGAIRPLCVDAVIARLQQANVWCVACGGDAWPALRDDTAGHDAGLVVEVPDPRYVNVKGIGRLVNFSRSTGEQAVSAPPYAPLPGEHTRQLLAELGYDAAEIDALYEERVVA